MSEYQELQGACGKAWRVDIEKLRGSGDHEGTVSVWIVEARWAHPFWHLYYVGVVHLRDIPNMPPPTVQFPGATHEVFVYAIDPEWKLDLMETPPLLQPCNFVGQIREASDGLAETRVENAVKEIIAGSLSPDTDFLREWIKRFGGACVKSEYL